LTCSDPLDGLALDGGVSFFGGAGVVLATVGGEVVTFLVVCATVGGTVVIFSVGLGVVGF
jgi:hypothetical protein